MKDWGGFEWFMGIGLSAMAILFIMLIIGIWQDSKQTDINRADYKVACQKASGEFHEMLHEKFICVKDNNIIHLPGTKDEWSWQEEEHQK
jgi:hypothetical protein